MLCRTVACSVTSVPAFANCTKANAGCVLCAPANENDSRAEIEAESDWLISHLGSDVPLHFTAFHPDWKMMDRPPTPPETLWMARQIARSVGLRYVCTGNIHDPDGQSTLCHGCGALL